MCVPDRMLVQVYVLVYWNRLVLSYNFVFAAHSSLLVTVVPDIIMLAISASGSALPDMDWGCRRHFWVTWRKSTLGGRCRLKRCGCACPVQCFLHCTCSTGPQLLFCSKKKQEQTGITQQSSGVANTFTQASLSNVLYGYQTNSWHPVSALSAERCWCQ